MLPFPALNKGLYAILPWPLCMLKPFSAHRLTRLSNLISLKLSFVFSMQILGIQEGLPSLKDAMLGRITTTHMQDESYLVAEKLLRAYKPDEVLEFMFRHGRGASACQLLYPPSEATGENPSHQTSEPHTLRSAFKI